MKGEEKHLSNNDWSQEEIDKILKWHEKVYGYSEIDNILLEKLLRAKDLGRTSK